MKKIFIVVNHDWFFLSHRKEIAVAAKKNGYEITIVSKNTGRFSEIESLGFKTINLPIDGAGKNIFNEIKTFIFLYYLYKKEKPTIVHHVGLKTIMWGSLAAKLVKVNAVFNAVSGLGVLFSGEKKTFITVLLLRILKFSHERERIAVVFQNNEDKDIFQNNQIISENYSFLTNGSGVDLNKYIYVPEIESEKIKILFTARMIKEKGVFILIDAAQKMKAKYNGRIQFLLCGGLHDNPKSIKKEQLIERCDGNYIQWLGHRDDIPELLRQSHIVAFPSYYREGIPKSLIEATAVGKPIITTNSIGCRETVIDGYNGYLIPIKDSDALAAKLELLIEDTTLRQTMGKNSRELSEQKFSVLKVVDKHLEIYNLLSK